MSQQYVHFGDDTNTTYYRKALVIENFLTTLDFSGLTFFRLIWVIGTPFLPLSAFIPDQPNPYVLLEIIYH